MALNPFCDTTLQIESLKRGLIENNVHFKHMIVGL